MFSGASNKTTLQNTLRTGVYAMVYIRQAADMAIDDNAITAEEHRLYYTTLTSFNAHDLNYLFIASGDDCVIWVQKKLTPYLVRAIRNLTSTKSDKPQRRGVGQVIKEIRVSEPHRIDFCSKWSYPTPNGIKFFRNINNCVKNSLRYNGTAEHLTNNPKEHSWLVGDALYRESGSAIAKEIG